MKTGPIVIVEDDEDDYNILTEAVRELAYPNLIHWYKNTEAAFDYICHTKDSPFVILCDVNMPGESGLKFKKRIDSDPQLRRKSIPFVFHTTSSQQLTVNMAFTELNVQGFFQKADNYQAIKENMKMILEYWGKCLHPNT